MLFLVLLTGFYQRKVPSYQAKLGQIHSIVSPSIDSSSLLPSAPASGAVPIFVGAGDIANCNTPYAAATANLLDTIPGTIYTLGDNAYPDGTAADFANCFEPTWGRHKARMKPSPGNHDYHVKGAADYYSYFGSAASPLDLNCISDCKGYYSYDLGAWHIIALNSEIDMDSGSAQEEWLRQDLAAHPTVCTLAYWHKPRFSSGDHQNSTKSQAIWEALYEYGADVVLGGHDHNYERFAPQNPAGELAPTRGIRQFIVGTGGTSQRAMGTIQPNSEVTAVEAWGVLKFALHATSYDWEFVSIENQTFRDSGNRPCVQIEMPDNLLERRVAQADNDAEETLATMAVALHSSDLELTTETGTPVVTQTVGIRFTNIALPQQISITHAYLEFTVDEVSIDTANLQIASEARGNTAAFVAINGNITERPRTTAVVAWTNAAPWPITGAKMRTPDIAPIVQEIIRRPDWSAGNAMAFIISGEGRRTAVAFDGNAQAAPLLHIEYETTVVAAAHTIYLPIVQQ